ncbi:hypothetical protein AN391_02307 [Pseudoalteromonas sp. P1-13-1a]|uniref:DUF4097 family beta strand repeat-containing protein n=1 Tax=Pseudoalteromonas sp. P1-13-1a TaxID=1723756 RepID=UPI0006D66BF8|nr:DUF4097 family beta strand repeat-containing protein [Pseudoalteromonas sp. P1-13-1a]KPZ56158.1 hypothetical protein AN391_02307 [Pseudoalteromonas sp. P1-13-1a]
MSSSTVSNITKPLSLIGGILLLSGCVFHISPSVASVKQTQQLSLPSNNLEYLNVLSGAGSLEIKGSPNATSISVDATIYTADIEDEYTLTLEQNGKQANLVAQNKSQNGINFYSGQSPHIDVVVTVPSNLNLDIDDGSGDMRISNVRGTLTVEDGSGSIAINNINGAVDVDDNSGDLVIEHVQASVTIEDGSGNIRVNHAKGLTITESGSGDVSIDNISGPVKVAD